MTRQRCSLVAVATSLLFILAACHGRGAPSHGEVTPLSAPSTPGSAAAGGSVPAAWAAYQANPNAAANLPNNSYAGYHYGAETLPTNSALPTFDVSMAPFSVNPNSAPADAQTGVRAAIAAAAGVGGGVVYFPAGTYQIDGPLIVNDSHVVLRGADMNSTILTFTQPLNTALGTSTNQLGNSNWGDEGGLVWFAPARVMAYHDPVPNMVSQTYWGLGRALGAVTAPASRGAVNLSVADANSVPQNTLLALQMVNPNDNSLAIHLAGDGNWAASYPWAQATDLAGEVVTWPFEVVASNGNTLTLAQPLRFDVRANWNPQIYRDEDANGGGGWTAGPLRESGIENLTLAMARTAAWDPNTSRGHEVGFNGAFFSNCFHCWAHAVTVTDAEGLAFGASAAKNLTLTGVHVGASSALLAPHRHALVVRLDAHDVLVDTFTIDSTPYYGLSIAGRSAGNVFTRGTMAHGTFAAQGLLPLETIFTDITVNNDGNADVAATAGPAGAARLVSWNVRLTGPLSHVASVAAMPRGAVAGVPGAFGTSTVDPVQGDSLCLVDADAVPTPANLYDAELQLRAP